MALGKHIAARYKTLRFIRMLCVFALLRYLRFYARLALFLSRPNVVGIAGSVGKSTTRNALSAIFTPYTPTRVVWGNSETGIPLGILGLDIGSYRSFDVLRVVLLAPFRIFTLQGISFLIVEMGIDGPKPPKNMAYLLTIVRPTIGILLNESPAHTEQYESSIGVGLPQDEQLQKIVSSMTHDDMRMLTSAACTTVILNTDDPILQAEITQVSNKRLLTVGHDANTDVRIATYHVAPSGTNISFLIHTHQIHEMISLSLPSFVLPEEAGSAIAAAILTAIHCHVPVRMIEKHLSTFSLPPGRGSILVGKKERIILDSSYNATSASVTSFLHILKTIKKESKHPSAFLFGDMKELGSASAQSHLEIARLTTGIVDHLVLVGSLTKQFVLPYAQKHKDKFKSMVWFPTSIDAGKYIDEHIPEQTLILAKGSQLLEEGIKLFLNDPDDVLKLCRQDLYWKRMKEKTGMWVEGISL